MTDHRVSTVFEDFAEDGSYRAILKAYGLEFSVTYRDGTYSGALTAKVKKPNWWIEAAHRMVLSEARDRVEARMAHA